jgi:hypothetical protein
VPSTVTLDGTTTDTDHPAFDAARALPVCSCPRARSQRTSDQLAYGATGHLRVRVCLHAGNTRAELDTLVSAIVSWAVGIARERAEFAVEGDEIRGHTHGMDPSRGGLLEFKL